MSGELRAQKTEVFFHSTTVKKIKNISDIGEFGPQSDDIDVTNFDSAGKEFLTGLADNGELTLQINFDPSDPIHQELRSEAGSGNRFKFIVCLSDGTNPPTIVSTVFTPPDERTSFLFEASVKSFRTNIKTNDAVRAPCVLRLSGGITDTWKA